MKFGSLKILAESLHFQKKNIIWQSTETVFFPPIYDPTIIEMPLFTNLYHFLYQQY